MNLPARFALLLLVLTILPFRLFPQAATTKKLPESATPEQTNNESTARFSRTYCEPASCVWKVLYFSNISQANELQDVVNAIRLMTQIAAIQPVPAARIIIVEGTAEQLAIAKKLAAEIDRDKRRFGGHGYRIDLRNLKEAGITAPERCKLFDRRR